MDKTNKKDKYGLTVKKSISIKAAAKKIWDIIISPATWDKWMLVVPVLENDKPVGLGSKVLWKDESGKPYLTGTVTVFQPNRKFVLELQDTSWTRKAKPGEVTYSLTLSEKNAKTHLAFTLGELSIDPEAQQWFDAYNESHELEDIKRMAEGGLSTKSAVEGF